VIGRRQYKSDKLLLYGRPREEVRVLAEALGVECEGDVAPLYVYGYLVNAIAGVEAVSKGLVDSVLEELVSRALRMLEERMASGQDGGLRRVYERVLAQKSFIKAMAYNDLRRLCVVSIGAGVDWRSGRSARLTRIGFIAARCAGRLRGLVGGRVLYGAAGAVPILLCRAGLCRDSCTRGEADVCLEGSIPEPLLREACRFRGMLLACGAPFIPLTVCR